MKKIIDRLLSWWREEARKLQGERFGIGLAMALALMSALAMVRGLMERMETLAFISALLLGSALLWPRVLSPLAWLLEAGFKTMTKALLYLLLVLVFYLVFAPVGLALRLLGKDPLQQKRDPAAPSYWRPKKPRDPKQAERQF